MLIHQTIASLPCEMRDKSLQFDRQQSYFCMYVRSVGSKIEKIIFMELIITDVGKLAGINFYLLV